ncbi:hypothetical protein BGZ58_000859 [Dissophora ornata]|nr:hypothetical protein BGZ58_000859 [Dissophora ornata]
MGLKSFVIPGNNTLSLVNGTSTAAQNISPYMVEFGRAGCADDNDQESEQQEQQQPGSEAIVVDTRPWIGFNIYNPVMNTWEGIDLVNATTDLGFNATSTLAIGNWLSPTVAIDNVNFAWYIILQSTVPLRQVILRKDLASLTSFMGRIDLTESHSTMFPTQLLYEGWELTSELDQNAPFVGRGVATVVRDKIIIISGTANSFTPGDAQTAAELRGCDHAYVFSTVTKIWTRQELTTVNNGVMPDTREKAAFLAVGSKIYMHGGVKPYQTVLSDLWSLDTDTWTWTRAADGPGPRADHTLLQYHEYLLAVSGFDVGRNVPVASVLPIMAYNTNTTAWTDLIRPTLDIETSFISNITRIAIIIGTVTFGLALLVLALSSRQFKKWSRGNYVKVSENFELDNQQRADGQSLPSILKKKYLGRGEDDSNHYSQGPQKGGSGGARSEVIFEDEEGEYGDEDGGYRDSEDEGDDHNKVQQRSLLTRPQAKPKPRPARHVRIDERIETREADVVDVERTEEGEMDEEDEEDEEEEGQVIVRMPPELSGTDE